MAIHHIELHPPADISSVVTSEETYNTFQQSINAETTMRRLPVGSHIITRPKAKNYKLEVTVMDNGTGLMRNQPISPDASLQGGYVQDNDKLEFRKTNGGTTTMIDAENPIILLAGGDQRKKLLFGAITYEDLGESDTDVFTLTQAREPVTIA